MRDSYVPVLKHGNWMLRDESAQFAGIGGWGAGEVRRSVPSRSQLHEGLDGSRPTNICLCSLSAVLGRLHCFNTKLFGMVGFAA